MIICSLCEGKKIIKHSTGDPVVCPFCKGSGKVLSEEEKNSENKKQLLQEVVWLIVTFFSINRYL